MDGALALLLLFPGAGIPKLGVRELLVTLPFVLGMVVPVVFRREYPVAAFVAVIVDGALQVLLMRRPSGPTWPSWSCSTRWPPAGRGGYRCAGWPSA